MLTPSEINLNELATSVHNKPGRYAVLLGAGISIAAGVNSAWDIVRDLIGQKAHLEEVNPMPQGEELDRWYQKRFNREPDYSTIIEEAERSAEGQQALLQQYFEPTDQDRAAKRKVPTDAHHAIARLCKEKFLRVIITTNFDRLMEQALDAAGVPYFTVTSVKEIQAAEPYIHGGVLLVKVHGDYLKANVRNSNKDLRSYPRALQKFLHRIFDEFGLITCGWSGKWDHALRECIEHSSNRRYTLYWSADRKPCQEALDLIRNRQGVLVDGMKANPFFTQLETKVMALKNRTRTAPQTLEMLEEEVKVCLGNLDRFEIQLQDLLEKEALRYNTDRLAFLNTPQPSISEVMAGITQLSKRVECVQNTLLKYDRAGKVLDLWEQAFLKNIQISPPVNNLVKVSMAMFTLSFMSHALRHEQWQYLDRFRHWTYQYTDGRMQNILHFMLFSNDARFTLEDMMKDQLPFPTFPVRHYILTQQTKWHKEWTLDATPAVFDFMLGEMVLSLMSLSELGRFTQGAFLLADYLGYVNTQPFHHWFKQHEAQLRKLLGGDFQVLLSKFQQECNTMGNTGALMGGGPHEGLLQIFQP